MELASLSSFQANIVRVYLKLEFAHNIKKALQCVNTHYERWKMWGDPVAFLLLYIEWAFWRDMFISDGKAHRVRWT